MKEDDKEKGRQTRDFRKEGREGQRKGRKEEGRINERGGGKGEEGEGEEKRKKKRKVGEKEGGKKRRRERETEQGGKTPLKFEIPSYQTTTSTTSWP